MKQEADRVMEDKNIKMAERIASRVEQEGGRAYYVGGFVRDRLLGKDNKDIDKLVLPLILLQSRKDTERKSYRHSYKG